MSRILFNIIFFFLLQFIIFKFDITGVVFYNSILATIIFTSLYAFYKYKTSVLNKNILNIIIIIFLSGFIWSITVPTIVDRSLSIFLLRSVEKNNNSGIKLSTLEKNIIHYINEYKVLDVRINEQLKSGNIKVINEKIYISNQGKLLLNLFDCIDIFYGFHNTNIKKCF